jgi:hypothetical protein
MAMLLRTLTSLVVGHRFMDSVWNRCLALSASGAYGDSQHSCERVLGKPAVVKSKGGPRTSQLAAVRGCGFLRYLSCDPRVLYLEFTSIEMLTLDA